MAREVDSLVDGDRWNHSIHYHPVVLDVLPPASSRVLDVGCGDGVLTGALARAGHSVVAIDVHEPTLDAARAAATEAGIDWVVGDFLAHPFQRESFDAVVSVAALHHMDEAAALARMAELVRPGGTVAVVGLARSTMPADAGWEAAARVASRIHKRRHGYWEISAPTVWPPPHTYNGLRRTSGRVLPGSEFRRCLLWRYTLVWRKPG